MRYMLKNARLAFDLYKPYEEGGKYSPKFIIPKDHPAVAELNAIFVKLANEEWPQKGAAMLAAIKQADKTCLHDGDLKPDWDGFEGNFYVNASSDTQPTTFDNLGQPVAQKGVNAPFSGCYVNASLEIWVQNNDFGKRINAQIRGAQFAANGDRFGSGGSPASADEFEPIAVDDEDLTA